MIWHIFCGGKIVTVLSMMFFRFPEYDGLPVFEGVVSRYPQEKYAAQKDSNLLNFAPINTEERRTCMPGMSKKMKHERSLHLSPGGHRTYNKRSPLQAKFPRNGCGMFLVLFRAHIIKLMEADYRKHQRAQER